MNLNLLGSNLKSAREAMNLSQLRLSEISGVTQASISNIEDRRNMNPKIVTLESLAGALAVTVGYLIGEESIHARYTPESLA